AVVLLAIGVAGSSSYGATKISHLHPNETMGIRGYKLQYLGSFVRRGPNDEELRARLAVWRGGDYVGTLAAGKNRYFAEQQTSNEVSIRTDWLRAAALFVIGNRLDNSGWVNLKLLVTPPVDT